MNLSKKKALAVKTLKKGKKRIVFLESRLNDIKEAITKQDIRDLHKEGAIVIKELKGKRKKKKRKTKKGKGNVRKKVNKRKKDYVTLTRKLRKYLNEIKNQKKLSKEESNEIGKRIRNKMFRSKSHMKEYIGGIKR
ncbi:MAG TPA: hypothetical protein ENG87_02695 [Candidatus Pacearchaeota archaeon]|nr:50S ribosomal protein L19e [archaeon BMS3Abin17]HDK42261.1 hypothetical protein [Candidatus Pacearchaeota archaeon]HDZ60405.1 hypothetical protein [Candidatus Pacearchaeota archaeon]